MRAGLSTIQQTLTPEAAAVLNRSIAEAARRNHGQTTPLHVAATLLAAPSGLLRQACIRSHPTSSHPLQCRALELCFSVSLDRLPSVNPPTTGSSDPSSDTSDPPISNALMAALKRAQAHQRRGCPEQQQQPLLAVKVELEQLVVSILDDPSVSRVMREASFSSPAVKATIEQSLSATATPSTTTTLGLSQRPPLAARNLYMNPLLHPHQGITDSSRKDEVSRVLDIMTRPKKRNPVLVADSDQAAVMREVLKKIEAGEAPPILRAAHVIPLEKEFCTTSDRSQIPARIKEFGSLIEARIGDGSGRGVVLDLGDLKWLVESPAGPGNSLQIVSETGRAAAAEMAKLLQRFGERAWILGTASCATFLRCQVYHPTMENDWDLQAVPIAPRSPAPTVMFPRYGGNGILSSSVESLAPVKGFPTLSTAGSPSLEPETQIKGFPALSTAATPLRRNTDPFRGTTLCAACMENYERDLCTLSSKEFEKSSSHLKPEARQALPHWMQSANPVNTKPTTDSLQCKEQELMGKQSTDELLKRWHETCCRLHHRRPNPLLIAREQPPAPAFLMPTTYNSITLPPRTPLQTKLTLTQSNDQASKQYSRLPERRPSTPPGSPVKTDLVLGHPKASAAEKAHSERVKDSTGCTQDGFSDKKADQDAGFSDYDSFKRLFKGLVEKVAWQQEAVSVVATTVMKCKSGNGKPRGAGAKGDTWLLFLGPDKVGKRKVAAALSELVFGTGPVSIDLSGGRHAGSEDGELDTSFRGRTALDRVSEAVRQNPFSVVVFEDIDRADMLVRASIKRTIERGRLVDSQGREVGLGSAIFVLTASWLPDELKSTHDSFLQCEERILKSANCGWQLELSVGDNTGKRGDETLCNRDRPTKLKKGLSGGAALSLDLNLAAGVEDDTGEGSRNSSDLTVEHDQETVRLAMSCPALSSASELTGFVDATIVFKPVDFGLLKRKVLESICTKFAGVMGGGRLIRVDDEALDRMVGGAWLAGAGDARGFEEWAERVLVPSMQQLQSNLKLGDGSVIVRLSVVKGGQRRWTGSDWLPATVAIAVDGL